MKKPINKQANKKEDLPPDLKHDTMEFSATTDGEDKLDTDDETYEEEEITQEELDSFEEDEIEEQEHAQVAAETDRATDEDNLPEESWEDDIPDNEEQEDEAKEHKREKRK